MPIHTLLSLGGSTRLLSSRTGIVLAIIEHLLRYILPSHKVGSSKELSDGITLDTESNVRFLELYQLEPLFDVWQRLLGCIDA